MKNSMDTSPEDAPNWMLVYTTPDILEAHVIAGRLKNEGVNPYIHTQPGASALGITLGTFGAISILVRPKDYNTAMAILQPDELDELPSTTDEYTWDSDDGFDDDQSDSHSG